MILRKIYNEIELFTRAHPTSLNSHCNTIINLGVSTPKSHAVNYLYHYFYLDQELFQKYIDDCKLSKAQYEVLKTNLKTYLDVEIR